MYGKEMLLFTDQQTHTQYRAPLTPPASTPRLVHDCASRVKPAKNRRHEVCGQNHCLQVTLGTPITKLSRPRRVWPSSKVQLRLNRGWVMVRVRRSESSSACRISTIELANTEHRASNRGSIQTRSRWRAAWIDVSNHAPARVDCPVANSNLSGRSPTRNIARARSDTG